MIRAAEALKLPSAQLTEEQLARADKLEAEIEEYARKNMEHRGFDGFKTKETDSNVIAEVNQRVKIAGYGPQWTALAEHNRFNAAAPPTLIGFALSMSPTDAAYKEAREETAKATDN